MTDYGDFGNLVTTAGCLAAAGGAITLSWMKRAKWQPPEEALPKIGARFAGLIAMVFIAIVYVFGGTMGLAYLAYLSGVLLLAAVIALSITIFTNITYSFYYPSRTEENRLLGGSVLTEEAAGIKKRKGQSEQEMLGDLQGERDKLWTKRSQAFVNLRSTLSFIVFLAFGTSALAAAAFLVVVYTSAVK
jgi:Na+(H+)/acetate symporter ActP